MKKLILFLTLLIAGFGANAQYTPSNNLNYIKLLKVPPVGSVEDSVMVFDGSDSFLKMRPASELITKATPTKSGVVKTNALEADPIVYTKTSVDNALKLKSYLSTGLLKNGLVQTNADPTKFNITSGIGIISNFDDPENPTSVVVNFPAFTGITPAYLTTSNITYIAINSTPSVVMQASPFTSEQRRDLIILGAAIHSDLTTINLVNNISAPTNAETNQLHDLMEVIGALNVSGNKYSANGVNLSLNKSAGEIFKLGVNFANDWKHPHDLDITGQTLLSFRYRTQNGTEGSDVTVLNPAVYDLANVLTAVPSNRFTIQTVTLFQTGQTRIQYGQNTYATLSEAEAAILTRPYITESNIATNGITRAYIIVRNNATDLTNATTSKIIEAQKFGGVTSGGVALTYANIVAALGYTPENAANKATDFTVINDVKYPSTQAVKNELKTNSITNNSSVIGVTTTDALNNLKTTSDGKLDELYVNNDYVAQNPPASLTSVLYESFPLMIRGQSNKMFLFYRQGADHATSKGIIQSRTSTDGGGTWTSPTTLVSDPTYDCRNVSGGVTPTGRIILFYMRYAYGSSLSFDQGYIYSDNEGSTWSTYTTIPNGTHTFYSPYGNLISIGDGKIMANWYGETPATPTYSSYIITSSDNGATWSAATAVATSTSIRYGEASYAYLYGGVILGMIRNSVGSPLYQVLSTNNGASWTNQGQVAFDSGTQVSPWITTHIDPNNEKQVSIFYANRSDNKLRVSSADYATAVAGTANWTPRIDLASHTITDFGYPTLIKSRENNKFLLGFYKASSTSLAAINFINYTPTYNNISVTGTVTSSGNITTITNVNATTGSLNGKEINATNFFTIKGNQTSFPSTGSGFELYNQTGVSILQSYDRTGAVYNQLNFRGSFQTWNIGASEKIRLHASGGVSIGNTTDLGASTLNVTGNITTIAATTANHVVIKSQLDAVMPYKVYTALISQSGTSAPTVTVLSNTLGGTIVWTRSGVGNYVGTLSGAFTTNKTAIMHGNGTSNTIVSSIVSSVNAVAVVTTTAGASADGLLSSTTLKIEVYP